MSPEDLVPAPDSCSCDVAAYSLGALDSVEAESFERHLRSCAVCPVELAAFQQVVDGIAGSVPVTPAPRAIKREVMRAVEAEPRGRTVAPARAPRRRLRLGVSGPVLVFGSGLAFAAAAIVVVVIALPGRMANRSIQASVQGPGSASLVIASGHSELVMHHFAAPPRGQIYEVWLQHGSRFTPAGELFSIGHSGDTTVEVPGSLYGVSHVLVTAEPSGGSRTPTHPPVITATI